MNKQCAVAVMWICLGLCSGVKALPELLPEFSHSDRVLLPLLTPTNSYNMEWVVEIWNRAHVVLVNRNPLTCQSGVSASRVFVPGQGHINMFEHLRKSFMAKFGYQSPRSLEMICTDMQDAWLRDQTVITAFDKVTNSSVHYAYQPHYGKLLYRHVSQDLSSLPVIPLTLTPSLLMADGRGQLYTTTRLLEMNSDLSLSARQLLGLKKSPDKVTHIMIEQVLHHYFEFDRLVWLQASPYEYSGHLDTVLMLVQHPQTQELHAFLSTHQETEMHHRYNARYSQIAEGYWAVGSLSKREIEHCSDAYQKFLTAKPTDALDTTRTLPIAFMQGEPALAHFLQHEKGRDPALSELASKVLQGNKGVDITPVNNLFGFKALINCLAKFAKERDQKASEIDESNRQILKEAGFDPEHIHSLPMAGTYTKESGDDGRASPLATANYVNALQVNGLVVVPKFPVFQQNPMRKTSSVHPNRKLNPSVKKHFERYFERVVDIDTLRDFHAMGSAHCLSYNLCVPH